MLAVIEDQYTNWTSFDLIEKLGGLNNESKVNKALSENINLKNLWLKLSKLKETANCIIFSLILYWNEDAKKNYINLVENVFQGYILKSEAISLDGKIDEIHIPKFKEFIKQDKIQRNLINNWRLINPRIKLSKSNSTHYIENGKNKLLIKTLPKYLRKFKSNKEEHSLHKLLKKFNK